MPNSIKYNVSAETLALKKGNFWIGTGDVGKGPTSTSGFYNGITPPSGGYTIYLNKASNGPSIYTPSNDAQLIDNTNKIAGTSYTTVNECFNYYAGQSDKMVFNRDYEGIITNGLVLNLDAGFIPSYPTNGTTSYDLSYEGNNGTLVNGTPYSSLDGGYFMFDGTDDYINVGVGKSCNGFTGDFAVSVWVNRSPNGITWGNIIGDYYTNNTFNALEWQIMISNTAQLTVYNVTGGYIINPINSGFSTDSWINVVLTRIGSTITLYANSNTITTVTNGTTFGSSTGNINIGVDGNNSAEALNGKIANVLIYKNKGLTSSEVLQNYNAGLSRFNTSNIVKNNLILDLNASNAVSYPTTGTVWRDLSGYGNAGTLVNGPTFNSTTKSIVFDGTDDNVNLGNASDFLYNGVVSVNVVVNTNVINEYRKMFVTVDSGTASIRGLYFSIGPPPYDVYFGVKTNNGQTAAIYNVNIPVSKWVNLCGTYDGSNIKLFLNGVLVATQALTGVINPQGIARISGYDNNNETWNGSIRTVQIYDRPLSNSEILQNYYGTPIITDGLILALDAKNIVSYPGSGTTWYDLTGNGAHGTLINGVSWNPNGWFEFDGTNDGVDGINVPQNYVDLMIGMYSEGGSGSGLEMVFAKYNDADKSFRTANGIFRHNNNSIDFNDWNYENTQYDYINGEFISGNVDLNNNWKIVRTVNQNSTFSPPFVYSISSDFYDRRYKGRIAFILCYNRVLTDDEVNQNYNATKARFGL
jgi:hypothetical protein